MGATGVRSRLCAKVEQRERRSVAAVYHEHPTKQRSCVLGFVKHLWRLHHDLHFSESLCTHVNNAGICISV